jgi:acyl-coenzyme A synthetase/AMP-(fatty) acid ligase
VSDVELTLPEQFNFTRDVVERLASDPNRRALTHLDAEGVIQRLTFAQVAENAARWAHLLRGGGLQPGDRVLVMLGKVPHWLGAMLGCIKGGLIAVPCSEMLRARDLAYRARHCEASIVVAERSAQAEIDAMRGDLDRPIDVLYLDDAELLLKRYRAVAPTEDTRWYDNALILYTSGTTGHAKGVTHTHGYTYAKRMQAEHWLTARPGDLVWCTAGTGWAKSIWNVLLGPWSRGAEIVLHQGAFDPAERFEIVDALGVTVLCQSPTEYRLMAKSDSLGAMTMSRLRHAVSAGEPLNPEVIELFREALGVTVYDGYGQTETTLIVANTRDRDVRPGSMGFPTPGHRVAVIDEDGNEVRAGTEGDIALHGRPPSLFAGYWEDRDATKAVFRDDWYITGDRAVRDDEGYFWFTGRADDVITSAAYRIGPFEVESALLEHPAVAESAVVGKPDPDRGQIVKAFVVLREGYGGGPELVSELQEHAKRVTAPYKYPREIEFVRELPKTRSGKIRRVELRERELMLAAAGSTSTASPPTPAPDSPGRAERLRREAELAAAEERMRRAAQARAARETEQRLPEPETELQAPAQPEREPEPWPQPEPQPEPEPEPWPQPEPEPEHESDPELRTTAETTGAARDPDGNLSLRERLERYAMRPSEPPDDDAA